MKRVNRALGASVWKLCGFGMPLIAHSLRDLYKNRIDSWTRCQLVRYGPLENLSRLPHQPLDARSNRSVRGNQGKFRANGVWGSKGEALILGRCLFSIRPARGGCQAWLFPPQDRHDPPTSGRATTAARIQVEPVMERRGAALAEKGPNCAPAEGAGARSRSVSGRRSRRRGSRQIQAWRAR